MARPYLQFPASPNLPLAPQQWDRQYQDQYSNVLRLYFNQLSQLLQLLGRTTGGYHLSFPCGAFHQDGTTTLSTAISNSSTTADVDVVSTVGFPDSGYILIETEILQYTGKTSTSFTGISRAALGTSGSGHSLGVYVTQALGTGSPTAISTVLFNNTDFSNGVRASLDDTKIVFDYAGLYNLQFSAQLFNYTTSEDNVTVWFRKNGLDIPASASIEQVNSKHGSSPGAVILSLNLFVEIASGDTVQLAWSSDTGNTVMATFPESTVPPVHPYSPGLIFTASFVSALPA